MKESSLVRKLGAWWGLVLALTMTSALFTPVAAAEASSPQAAPYVVGGTVANDPRIVQLRFGQNGSTHGCTGEAIGAEWVLTARHCTDGISWMDVHYSNSTRFPGAPTPADAVYNSPYGDVALVHLSTPHELSSYAPMADAYTPQPGDSGRIYGYGLRANRVRADHLYTAKVTVTGSSRDAYGGQAIHVTGVTGASNHGDSGGPLFVNGRIVGVCSTGDTADPGADINAGSNYANLTAHRQWIQQVSGI